MTRGRFILFLLLCLTLAGFFLPDQRLLSELAPYLTALWLLWHWRRYRAPVLALLQTHTGRLLAGMFGISLVSIGWSGDTAAGMAKSVGYCLWVLGFVLALIFTVAEKPARQYTLLGILLVGSLISALYGISTFIQDRHSAANPRLHESFMPLARCQVPLDRPHTVSDVTVLSNLDCEDLAQQNKESLLYPYWRLMSYGKLDHAVLSAMVYGLCLTLCLALLKGATTVQRLALGGAALVFGLALYLCGSLGILAGLGLALAFTLSHWLVRQHLWKPRYGWVVGAVAVVGGLLLQDYVSAIIALLPRGLSFRDQIWSQMLTQMSAAQWVWGHGLGHPLSITLPSGVEHVHPHSIYFTMLFSSGLIGLLMLLAVLGNALLSAFRRPELRLAGVLLAYSMGPLALDGDQLVSKLDVHWLLIWLPLGLIAAGQFRADRAAAGS